MEQQTTSPLDGAIGMVQRYIAKPALVTPDTLQHLLDELESVKSYMTEEDSQESEAAAPQGPGLASKGSDGQ